jgi:hypothetical protein
MFEDHMAVWAVLPSPESGMLALREGAAWPVSLEGLLLPGGGGGEEPAAAEILDSRMLVKGGEK